MSSDIVKMCQTQNKQDLLHFLLCCAPICNGFLGLALNFHQF